MNNKPEILKLTGQLCIVTVLELFTTYSEYTQSTSFTYVMTEDTDIFLNIHTNML
jgi:hypothetical protein